MFHFDRDFVDKNGERYMLPVRIQSLAKILLRDYVVKETLPCGDFQYAEGDMTYAQMKCHTQWEAFTAGRSMWGQPDQFVWFRQVIEIPERLRGQDVWYLVYPYTADQWPWGQPQIQLFVNGECVCGLDNNHRRYLLCRNAAGGERLEIAMKTYSDLKYFHGCMTMRAELQVVRPHVYELYQSIMVPMQAASLMQSDDAARVEIVKKLNEAMNRLDMDADPDSEEFRASVEQTEAYLQKELYGTMENGTEPMMWSIGHTHIDVAWQWTYHITRNKTARSFATTLRLLENNPDYLFMSSQPQLYDFIKQDAPEIYEQMRKYIAEGRWEPEGGMWVEADTNLTGGESLVRQFLLGKRFFRDEFGVENHVLWLPDVFGYSANLPQICKRSGIDYFYTTKIGWNEYDKFPYDTFRWRGLDGSTVLTHFGCAIRYAEPEKDWMTTYNPTLEPCFVLGAWHRYQQKDINSDLLYDYGFGDGGGGPTQEMIDYGRRFERGIPGCPKVRFAKVGDYFRHLEQTVAEHPKLPEWDGEMYLEFHRGTYTSQAMAKKQNRQSEKLYHDIENLWSLALAAGVPAEQYPAQELNENWKLILLNQFHDVLPGSSIHQVYEDSARHYAKVLGEGGELLLDAETRLAEKISVRGESIVVFNTLSSRRSPVVELDGAIPGLLDTDGTPVPCQRTHDGRTVFLAPDVPAKGWKTFAIAPTVEPSAPAVTVTEKCIDTPELHVEFDAHMHITSLYSKKAGRELLPAGQVGGRVIAYQDVARMDDAWNVQAYYQEKGACIDDVSGVELLENGPVRWVLRVNRKFRRSTVQMDILVYAGSDQLIFDYTVDWHERNLFVKAEYPVDVNAKNASYEIQFGYVERPVHKNTLWDFARFEVCAHKWADLSDNGFGLAILNDCKYGYDASRNCLRLSLLKCSTYPDSDQDQGMHRFSYAVYPHAGNAIEAGVRARGYDFNYRAHTLRIAGAQEGTLPAELSMLCVDAPNIVVETVKKAEDANALIVRMYEAENCRTVCRLKTAFRAASAQETNLMEEPERALECGPDGIALEFHPFEIKTVMLAL